ncbi:MAG: hypothetical protein IBX41_06820 [Methanophagales archaeon]|nr:hypothetical protein [Methanophagales archaeon]
MRYAELLCHFRKSLRNGNWHRLSYLEKGLYRAILCYTKVKGEIVNAKLRAMVLRIVEKLRETPRLRILKAGQEKAKRILSTYMEKDVFDWCPELKGWLENPDYIFWLGIATLTGIRHSSRSLFR